MPRPHPTSGAGAFAIVVLWLIGDALRRKGELDGALDYTQQGVSVLRASGNRWTEAMALRQLGQAYLDLRRFNDAISVQEHALALNRDLDDPHQAAITLQALGETRHRAGDSGKARQCWEEALAIFEDLNSPRAAELRACLDSLG